MRSPELPAPPFALVESAQTAKELKTAVGESDWDLVRALVAQLAAQLEVLAGSSPEDARILGQQAIRALRKEKRYRDGVRLGNLLLSVLGDEAPILVHELTLCMVNAKEDSAPAAELLYEARSWVIDALGRVAIGSGEWAQLSHVRIEIEALLGRISKDRFFAGVETGQRDPDHLRRAIEAYKRAYDAITFDGYEGIDEIGDPFTSRSDRSFVGENAAVLLRYAAAHGLPIRGVEEPQREAERIAREIVRELGTTYLHAWDHATRMSCFLVLGEAQLAKYSLDLYLESDASPFAFESTYRLFKLLWADPQAAKVAAPLEEALKQKTASPSATWVVPRSNEIMLKTPRGDRYGVLVEALWGAHPRRLLITSGDVAWYDEVTCVVETEVLTTDIVLDVSQSLLASSSPWLLDVAVLDLESTGYDEIVHPGATLPVLRARTRPLPALDADLLREAKYWMARVRQAGDGPLVGVSISRVRTDRRYLRFSPAAVADGDAPGAPLIDQDGRLVAVQRQADGAEFEAVLWEAIAGLAPREGAVL